MPGGWLRRIFMRQTGKQDGKRTRNTWPQMAGTLAPWTGHVSGAAPDEHTVPCARGSRLSASEAPRCKLGRVMRAESLSPTPPNI